MKLAVLKPVSCVVNRSARSARNHSSVKILLGNSVLGNVCTNLGAVLSRHSWLRTGDANQGRRISINDRSMARKKNVTGARKYLDVTISHARNAGSAVVACRRIISSHSVLIQNYDLMWPMVEHSASHAIVLLQHTVGVDTGLNAKANEIAVRRLAQEVLPL